MLRVSLKQAGQPLVIENRPIPRPEPGQAVIRAHRHGICGTGRTGEMISLSALPVRFEAMRHRSHAVKILVNPQG